jgi:hypothetical protein
MLTTQLITDGAYIKNGKTEPVVGLDRMEQAAAA